jgi:hypothetical protein
MIAVWAILGIDSMCGINSGARGPYRRARVITEEKEKIDFKSVTTDYSYHMNGVDHKDRDTADWMVLLKLD